MSFPVHMASNFLITTLKKIFWGDILFSLFLFCLFYSNRSSLQQSSMWGFLPQQRFGLFAEGVGRAQRAPAPCCCPLTFTCKLETRESLPVWIATLTLSSKYLWWTLWGTAHISILGTEGWFSRLLGALPEMTLTVSPLWGLPQPEKSCFTNDYTAL